MILSQENKQSLLTALLSSLCTIILLLLLNYFFNHSLNLFASSTSSQLFTSQGTSTISQKPDAASVSFTVTKSAPQLLDAQNQTNTLVNTMVSDLKKQGIESQDIQTSNYSSSPTYTTTPVVPNIALPDQEGNQTITGYTVSEDVTVTLSNIQKANEVIDLVTKDGAQDVSGPNLTFSQATQQTLEDQARVQAVQNAKQKAETLASAAGIHLGRVVNIQEDNMPYVVPMLMRGAALNTAPQSAPTQINPGQNTITETVTLSFETW